MNPKKSYKSFQEFWPFYLSQHQNPQCRMLHFLGSSLALVFLNLAFFKSQGIWIFLALFVGYGCAWLGHLAFEKNRPATFQYPIYSFLADWKMFWSILRRKRLDVASHKA